MDHEDDLEILKLSFPTVTCYCELCDCGRHRHHVDCRKSRKRGKVPGNVKFQAKTDYQDTFKSFYNPKPRSSKRPRTPRRVVPPPLDGRTWQKDEFKPIDVEKHTRPAAYHKLEEYVAPGVPFDHQTKYSTDFIPKPLGKVEREAVKTDSFKIAGGTFHSATTHNDTYKTWRQEDNWSYTEPPSFLSSMLFPSNKQEEVKSVMRHSFPGAKGEKAEPAHIPPSNIRVGEGDYDHLTVHRDVYRGKPGKASSLIPQNPELTAADSRKPFHAETQTKHDFRDFGANSKRKPACPAPATIDLKFNNKRSFSTEQRSIYRGHDTQIHVPPPPARTEHSDYQPPTVAFQTITSHKADFTPRDLTLAAQERAKMPEAKWDFGGKFQSETSYNHYYKDVAPRRVPRRYGDFVDGINSLYLPPVTKLESVTTQKAEFVPKVGEMRANMKPAQEPIDKQGKHDFETIHRATYRGHQPQLCKSQLYLLQQQLKTRLAAEGVEPSPLARAVRPAANVAVRG